MEMLTALFGTENHVSTGQICARAVLLFLYGLLMLRLSGRRTFAEWSALDVLIVVMAGSAMGRALMGSGSLPGAMAAVAVLVLLHRALSYAVAKMPGLANVVEGRPVVLARDGVLDEEARCRHNVACAEIGAAMRAKDLDGLEDMDKVRAIILEPTGDISVLKRS
jgi:uncharacterized membrane protein YcaP (DUF421 family)